MNIQQRQQLEDAFFDAGLAMLKQIKAMAEDPDVARNDPDALCKLAEAYAWIRSPGESHGGG